MTKAKPKKSKLTDKYVAAIRAVRRGIVSAVEEVEIAEGELACAEGDLEDLKARLRKLLCARRKATGK